MRAWLRKFWPVIKWLLTVAILLAIGRHVYRDLHNNPELWDTPLDFGWLALSGLLCVVA